jgi:oligoribonuclease
MSAAAEPTSVPQGKPGDRIVWVDCEMTGLDLGSDALVEVACVVTDA